MNQLKLGFTVMFVIIVIIFVAVTSVLYFAPVSSPELTQINKELDSSAMEFLNVCSESVSISDLDGCKIKLKEISDTCNTDTGFEKLLFCNSENEINQFYSTVDQKIETARNTINDAAVKLIDACSDEFASVESCQTSMIQLQEDCNKYNLSACDDTRFQEILDGNISHPETTYSDFTAQQELDEFTNQQMLDFIEQCISTDNQAEIQICAGNAKEMLNLCAISIVEACTDPRLQIIAYRVDWFSFSSFYDYVLPISI